MGKLVIKYQDNVVDHVDLHQGDMKIGRRPGCEIVIDHLAISGEHANIFTIGGDSFIQDLNSTNGTFVNNKRAAKHHLRNGDMIAIGQHTLVFLDESVQSTQDGDTLAKTVIIAPAAPTTTKPGPVAAARPMPTRPAEAASEQATVERRGELFVLDGKNTGKRIELTKAVTNLGKTGKHAGVIRRSGDTYTLDAVDPSDRPKLNGRAIPDSAVRLRNGDIIEVAGTRLQFYLK
jgi:hypothetical protein